MSIKATAGTVTFLFSNANRTHANPPIVFSDHTSAAHFSFSIWVKLSSAPSTENLFAYQGTDGSRIAVDHDFGNWIFKVRQGSTELIPVVIAGITLNRWTLFVFVKDGPNTGFYYGLEDDPASTTSRVTLTKMNVGGLFHDFTFINFIFSISPNMSVCNLKYWNTVFTPAESVYAINASKWRADTDSVLPIWSSAMRTPGDMSSISFPYASPFWREGHYYTDVVPSDTFSNFAFDSDPAYMANQEICPTWVYPLPLIGAVCNVNPGTTPLIPTIYKAPQFFKFHDRGSIPVTPFQSILYYGFPSVVGPGAAPSDTWGLFKDDNGIEVSDTSSAIYKFTSGDTAVEIPGLITSSTMYKWQFGAQFTYQPATPAVPTAMGQLSNLMLLVNYIGFPLGRSILPEVDMVGLFAVRAGKSVDRYNRGIELPIPSPTIRTAYIGE